MQPPYSHGYWIGEDAFAKRCKVGEPVEDAQIIDLFWQRDEAALDEVAKKYGRFCLSIAKRVQRDTQDAQECVNDTYLAAWNAIPPHDPISLSAFLGKITRYLALKKYRDKTRGKRGGTNVDVSLEELNELAPPEALTDAGLSDEELAQIMRDFIAELPANERRVFLRRYFFFDSIGDICTRFGFSKSKVKSMLKRTRDKLKVRLRKEGVWV